MGRRSDHSREELFNLAVSSASYILNSEGLQAVTARSIAKEMGYSAGTLYNVFNDINDLLQHVHAETLEILQIDLISSVKNIDEPVLKIKAMAKAYYNFTNQYSKRWQALLVHRLPEGQMRPDWYRAKVEACVSLVSNEFVQILGKNRQSDARLFSAIIWAGLHGLCSLTVDKTIEAVVNQPDEKLLDVFVEMCLKGMEV